MGAKPLTWQQILIVFLVIGLLVAGIFAWGGNIPPDYRPWGFWSFWALVAVIALLLVSHVRQSGREDTQPDLLAMMFSPGTIMQSKSVHFVLIGKQVGPWLHLLLVVQNLRDGEGNFSLTLRTESGNSNHIPIFQGELAPASLVLATARMALVQINRPLELRWAMVAGGKAAGKLVRFGRRAAATRKMPMWMAVMALMGGAIVFRRGGTFWKISYVPTPAPPTNEQSDRMWRSATIWTPENPVDEADLVSLINETFARGGLG